MAGKEPDIGSTARTVAENVNRLRVDQNMNFTELSERLEARAGWSINAVGIRRIESGERRVTPDDLVALALALGVSPITLLAPNADDRDALVSVTGLTELFSAEDVWKWFRADDRLPAITTADELIDFMKSALPDWRRREWAEGAFKLIQFDLEHMGPEPDGES